MVLEKSIVSYGCGVVFFVTAYIIPSSIMFTIDYIANEKINWAKAIIGFIINEKINGIK